MITLKDILKLKPAPNEPVHEYLLIKVGNMNKLYQVNQGSFYDDNEETQDSENFAKQDLVEVQVFAEIPAIKAQKEKQITVKALSFFEHLLVLLFDDSQMVVIDIHQSWVDPIFSCNLQNLNNIKLAKVSDDQFMVISI